METMETYTPEKRAALLHDWSSYTNSYVTIPNFIMQAFGTAVWDRWKGPDLPQRLCDAVVEATIEACLADETMRLEDYSYIIGHRHLSRTEPAFHNYTVEQAQKLIPRIAALWHEASDEELKEAMEHQREDNLLAYTMSRYETLPFEYAVAVVAA